MPKIRYRIHEGRYIELSDPCDASEVHCLRCGGKKGHSFNERDDIFSWFCLNPECLQIDCKISKSIARKKAFGKLKEEQNDAYKERMEGK